MLSEKALKAITKLYEKVDFKETSIALDLTMKRLYLEKEIMEKLLNQICVLYKEIMQHQR
jgi:hypothetical protein